jgi:hypothetical protein
MQKQVAYIIAFMLILIAGLGLVWFLLSPKSVSLNRQFESNAFRFRYPDDWSYQIPQPNIMFLASPELSQAGTGASMSIQRSLRLSAEANSLESALNIYLERGPLRADRAWTVIGDTASIRFNGRQAFRVMVEGAEIIGTTAMHSEIMITQADNGLYYLFTITAPIEKWAQDEPIFQAILASVEILE